MELFKLFGTIAVNNDKANKSIDETTDKAENSHLKIGSAFGKIGKAAVKVGKVVAVGMGAAAAGIGKLTKDAISEYADYEQLVGGVETLFKDSSDKVMEYSKSAYKTAGLSANDYMETITGFSASLLQSLDGDTKKAAEAGNQAVIDMSDNANKMGTQMESIQNAYQGFAKQNYTMLDNLKLGYGGTKEEMQRLLADAQKISGQKYDLSSFADITEAIHVVQTEMGITGTTSKEAATTIQGSIGMMKGAWTNFMTGMADENQDFDQLLTNLVDSIGTVADNLVPRIAQTVPRLVSGLVELVNNIATYIPDLIGDLLPPLIAGATKLFNSVVQSLPQLLNILIQSLPQLINGVIQIVNGLIAALPQVVNLICAALPQIIQPLINSLPQVVQSVVDVLPQIIQALLDAIPQIMQAGTELIKQLANGVAMGLPDLINQVLPMIMEFTGSFKDNAGELIGAGIELLLNLAQGLIDSLPTMIETIPTIVSNIANIINENAPKLIMAAGVLILNLAKGLIKAIPTLIKELPKIVKAIFDVWSAINWVNLGKNVVTAIKNGIKELPKILSNIWSNIKNGASKMWGSIKTAITSPVQGAQGLIQKLAGSIKSILSGAWNGIKSVTTSVWNGIKSAITNPIETAKKVIKGIIDKIKSMFKFTIALPHIKMPHFNISPKGWKVGDLLKGSIPTLGIKWYAKAMDEPYMFTQPTITSTASGLKGFGEAGDEMVYGKQNLLDDIASVTKNDEVVSVLSKLLDEVRMTRKNLFDIIVKALHEMKVEFDERELARMVRKYA